MSSCSSKDDFLKSAMLARNMIEEAKVLSKALRPHENLSYELLTASPVLSLHELGTPNLCIRVLKNGNPAPAEVALWSFSTFQNRLNLMRHAYSLRGSRPTTPAAVHDPWCELTACCHSGLASAEAPKAQLPYPVAVSPPTPTTVYRSPVQVAPALNPQNPQWRSPANWTSFGLASHPGVQAVSVSYRVPQIPAPPSCTSSPRIARRSVQGVEQAPSASPSTRFREI